MSRPLSVLLAQAITIETRSVDVRTGISGSLALWANILQHVPAEGLDTRSLPARSCLSKRALVTGTKRAVRLGLAVVEPGTSRGEQWLRLTASGSGAVEAWRPSLDGGDGGDGGAVAPSLRDALVTVVCGLELEHPHFPTQYGTADQSITGGPGQDWKPVHRAGTSGVSSLPLVALLSQAFCALAIQYERSNGALGWGSVLAAVPTSGRGLPVSELPRWADSMLGGMARHRRVKVAGGRVTSTSLGARLRDNHEPTLASIEQAWRERHGAPVVNVLSAGLVSFVDASGVDVADVRHPPTHALFGYHAA